MVSTCQAIANEEKRLALKLALESRGLARSSQLKTLLRYLCEKEIEGEAEKLTEYQIGVEALGLPEHYSPGEDSTVRNRAFVLRRKLDEAYQGELADAAVRIEIPKGSYVARYLTVEIAEPVEEIPEPVVPPEPPAVVPPAAKTTASWLVFLAGAVAMACAGLGIFWIQEGRTRPGAIHPLIAEAWGPLLRPDGNVLLCMAASAQLVVRPTPGEVKSTSDQPVFPTASGMTEWYRSLRSVPEGKMFLYPTQSSIGVGDAVGAAQAARQLTMAGVSFQMMPERLVPYASTRRRNIIVFGLPEDSEIIRRHLENAPLRVEHAESKGDFLIREYVGEKRIFYPERDGHGTLKSVYGLLTILDSEGSEGQQRTIIVSRTHSAGAQATVEFLTSAASLKGLLKSMGRREFPKAYQVVVRTDTDSTLPLSFHYAAHAILE